MCARVNVINTTCELNNNTVILNTCKLNNNMCTRSKYTLNNSKPRDTQITHKLTLLWTHRGHIGHTKIGINLCDKITAILICWPISYHIICLIERTVCYWKRVLNETMGLGYYNNLQSRHRQEIHRCCKSKHSQITLTTELLEGIIVFNTCSYNV